MRIENYIFKLKGIISRIHENFFDIKFRKYKKNYILQCLLIFACITAVMLLYELVGGVVVASLGATSFILFVTPHTNGSRARYVIGGYMSAVVVGSVTRAGFAYVSALDFAAQNFVLILLYAAAVAITSFIMIIANLEHPPAAALALGLTADTSHNLTAFAALAGVIILCVIRAVLKKHLKNLI